MAAAIGIGNKKWGLGLPAYMHMGEIGRAIVPLEGAIRCSRARGPTPGEAAVDSYEHNCDSGISNTAASFSRLLPPGELTARHPPQRDRIAVRVGRTLLGDPAQLSLSS